MKTLSELQADKAFSTDKANSDHVFFGRSHLDVFDLYFGALRESARCVLEIGVLFGGSLELLEAYFPNARVVGVDINPECAAHAGGRREVVIGSQGDDEFMAGVGRIYDPIDVVIDDGSHYLPHALATFRTLFAHVTHRGLYVFEDTCVMKYYGVDANWPGMRCDPLAKTYPLNDTAEFNRFLAALIQDVDQGLGLVRAIHIHPNITILEHA